MSESRDMRRQEELGSDLPMVSGCLWSTSFSLLTKDGIWSAMLCYALLPPVPKMTKEMTMQRVDGFEAHSGG